MERDNKRQRNIKKKEDREGKRNEGRLGDWLLIRIAPGAVTEKL